MEGRVPCLLQMLSGLEGGGGRGNGASLSLCAQRQMRSKASNSAVKENIRNLIGWPKHDLYYRIIFLVNKIIQN